MSRPTIRLYNEAIQRADNWRQNYDTQMTRIDYLYGLAMKYKKALPLAFFIGVMVGVLGILLAAQAFNLN